MPKSPDVYIGIGKLDGKGVYAARDFQPGEAVKYYNLRELSQEEFDRLPRTERKFVHSFWGRMFLFPEPSRYTNHSSAPNTRSDLEKQCDYAIRSIKKGDMITTNATEEVRNELITFAEALEGGRVSSFRWTKGDYRNVVVQYALGEGSVKELRLKRIDGNWRVIS